MPHSELQKKDAERERDRLAALRSYNVLDTPNETELDHVVQLASALMGVPISLISLIDENRQWFKAAEGLDVIETSRDIAFCEHTIKGDEIFEIEDAQQDPRFSDNPMVTSDPNIRFYAGAPLISPEGHRLGALCVIDRVPRKLTKDQKEKLFSLSKLVMSHFEIKRKKLEVETARNHYESILASAGDIIYTADEKGNFDFISRAVEKITGYTANELRNKHFTWLVTDEWKKKVSQFYLRQFRERIPESTLEFCINTKSGASKWVEQTVAMIISPQNIVSFQGVVRDIDERKHMEMDLAKVTGQVEETRFMLQSILDNTSSVVFIKDLRHRYILVNQTFTEVFGLAFDKVREKTDYDFRDEKVAKSLQQSDKEVIRKKKPLDFEYSFFIEGAKRTFLSRVFPVYDAAGEMYGVCGVYTEITAQKKVQELLREKDKRFSRIFHVSPAAMILSTVNPNVMVEVNNAFTQLTGYSQNDIIGKNTAELGMISDEERRNALQIFKNRGSLRNFELSFYAKDGSRKTTLMSSELIQLNGTDHALSLYYDITERKKVEAQLANAKALLTEAMSIGRIGSFENNLREGTISWSPEIYAIMDMEPGEHPLSYDDYIARVHPDDLQMVLAKIGESMKDKKPDVTINRFVTGKGKVKWIETRVVPMLDAQKELYSFRGTMQDITDKKEIESQLREAKQLAEESAQAKELFLANMSHEIRTPLNGLIGFVDLLEQTQLDGEQAEYLEIIKLSGKNLLSVINDILDYSKIEAGMMHLERLPFDVKKLAEASLKLIKPQAGSKKLKLINNISKDLPAFLIGDPTRFSQILNNLLGNAVKFTEKGEVALKVEANYKDGSHVLLSLSVSDTGIGISEQMQSSIFERFNQGSNDTSRKFGGTGLGLSIVKKLTEMQGGSVTLLSKPGKGSVFSVTIPYELAGDDAGIYKAPAKKTKAAATGIRVLLVEDHPINRKLALKILQNAGMVCQIAENGKEAVDLVRKNQYQVILMDIQMPEMDGYEATRVIRNTLGNNTPIVAMTAHAMSSEKTKCFELGMNDYLSKPFSAEQLVQTVNSLAGSLTAVAGNIAENGNSKPSLHQLNDLSGGDPTFIREILSMFLNIIPDELERMNQALDKNDLSTFRNAAHKMKSPLPLLGLTSQLTELDLMEKSEDKALLKSALAHIEESCVQALKFAEKELKKLDKKNPG